MSASTSAVARRPGFSVPALSWIVATPLRRTMALTATWRVVIALWGIVAHGLVAKGPYASETLMHRGWPSNPLTFLVDAGVRMDGFWYGGIAQHGYTYSPKHLSSIAFFPLYPAVIKAVSLVTGDVYLAGLVISTVSLFLAMWALQVWLDHRGFGASTTLAAGLMLCYPVGFFWAAMYTESLFLLLAVATFVFCEDKRWFWAAAAAFLAVLCRPTGLILAPCLAVMAWQVQGSKFKVQGAAERWAAFRSGLGRFRVRAADPAGPLGSGSPTPSTDGSLVAGGAWAWALPFLPVIAGPVAYGCFAAYQWVAFGTPLATVRADQRPPFSRNLAEGISDLMLRRPGFPPWYLAGLLGIGLLFLAAVPLVYRRFGAPYALFAALTVIFPLSTGLVSLERYVMIDFPVFAAVALVKRRPVVISMMTLGFYMSLGLMALFVAGYTII